MKNFRKLTALVLMMACFACLFPLTASATNDFELKTALELLDPEAPSVEEAKMAKRQEVLDELIYEAYYTYEYMSVPNLRDILDKVEIRYVLPQNRTLNYIDYYDRPDGSVLGNIGCTTRALVYARRADWAFIKISDGTVGWVKAGDILATHYGWLYGTPVVWY